LYFGLVPKHIAANGGSNETDLDQTDAAPSQWLCKFAHEEDVNEGPEEGSC